MWWVVNSVDIRFSCCNVLVGFCCRLWFDLRVTLGLACCLLFASSWVRLGCCFVVAFGFCLV